MLYRPGFSVFTINIRGLDGGKTREQDCETFTRWKLVRLLSGFLHRVALLVDFIALDLVYSL